MWVYCDSCYYFKFICICNSIIMFVLLVCIFILQYKCEVFYVKNMVWLIWLCIFDKVYIINVSDDEVMVRL